MSDKTIRLLIDLTYDQDVMHAGDEEAIEWFNGILLGDHLQLGDFGDLGDMIGSVKVIEGGPDRIEELEAESKRLRLEVQHANDVADVAIEKAKELEEEVGVLRTEKHADAECIAELKAKLAKAVEALEDAEYELLEWLRGQI